MKQSTYFNDIKRIGILSFQDSRKDLIEWSYGKKHELKNHIIISTARTASLLEGTLNTPVLNLQHGRSGGYQQVRNLIQENKIDVLLLFGKANSIADREGWFKELVDLAIQHDVAVGYNQSTIDMLVNAISVPVTEGSIDAKSLFREMV